MYETIGGRRRVVDLDRNSFVHTHLLHQTVEEVLLLLVGSNGEDPSKSLRGAASISSRQNAARSSHGPRVATTGAESDRIRPILHQLASPGFSTSVEVRARPQDGDPRNDTREGHGDKKDVHSHESESLHDGRSPSSRASE